MRVMAGIVLIVTAVLSSSIFAGEEEKPVQIVLYPSPEPRPALKYQLLPPFLERRPGNAAVWWNRLPAEMNAFFAEFDKEFNAGSNPPGRIGKWMEIPLGDPREKAYRETELAKVVHLLRPQQIYYDMDRAARFESCDWQLPIREGNSLEIFLPEIQHSRVYARMLSAKAHLEIAEGKYDQAVRTLQTGYAEARHVGQGPFFVCSLVGLTIAGMMSHEVQQFIQQPGAPNLYWAISTLPRPLIDFRPAGESEANLLYLQWPELRDLNKKKLSPDEWRTLLNKVMKSVLELGEGRNPDADTIPAVVTALSIQGYPRAKRALIEQGRTASDVEAMPVAQVVLLYSVRLYDELSDDQFKWFFLPAAEAGNGPQRMEQRMKEVFAVKREIVPLASILIPANTAAKHAETRCAWNIAILRIFEAMRLYAATHDGQWPDRLDDITEVPIPTNPFDDKPFLYERHGDKAVVNSEHGPRGMPWRYEITLMPKAK